MRRIPTNIYKEYYIDYWIDHEQGNILWGFIFKRYIVWHLKRKWYEFKLIDCIILVAIIPIAIKVMVTGRMIYKPPIHTI